MLRLGLITVLVLISSLPVFAKPKIEVTPLEKDLGTHPQNTSVTDKFSIKNTGDADLVVGAIKTSCGCTAAKMQRTTIPPGEAEDLVFTMETRTYEGDLKREITIPSNDPAKETVLKFRIKVESTAEFETDPPAPFFGAVAAGKEKTATFKVMSRKREAQKVRRVVYDEKRLTVTYAPGADPWATEVNVTCKADVPAGPLVETVRLEFESGKALSVTLHGYMGGDITLNPATGFYFTDLRPGEGAVRKVSLASNAKVPFEVTSVKVPDGVPVQVKASLRLTDEDTIVLTATLLDGGKDNLSANVVVETTHSAQKTLTVPLRVVYQKSGN